MGNRARYILLIITFSFLIIAKTKAQCPDGIILIEILTDDFGSETTWELVDAISGTPVANGGPYANNTLQVIPVCVTSGITYNFIIYDSFGDGICCTWGNGYYNVYNCGALAGGNSNFTTAQDNVNGIVALGGCIPPAGTNDSCQIAQNLGRLIPTYELCVPGTNIGMSPDNPYIYQQNCHNTGTGMPVAATDVWYTFTADSNSLDVNISGGLNDPVVGLYEGNCGSLIGAGCAIGSAGSLSATFYNINPGNTYYLQVSGSTTSATGDFTLCLINYQEDFCIGSQSLTVNPLPSNDIYQTGQAVTFCLTVEGYNLLALNWFHGMVPVFGNGWDQSSITNIASPASCDGYGQWGWYNNVVSSFTGNSYGPGFFYESPFGNPLTISDGNPGNNFGDDCTTGSWTFCFTISPKICPANPAPQDIDLSIIFENYGDSESGIWNEPDCDEDPNYIFNARLVCCQPPLITTRDAGCGHVANGLAIAQGQGTSPWNYIWQNNGGIIIRHTAGSPGPDTLMNIAAGIYTVIVVDNDSCISSNQIVINAPHVMTLSTLVSDVSCQGGSDGAIDLTVSGGTSPLTFTWSNGTQTEDLAGIPAGSYNVIVEDSNSCRDSIIAVVGEPDSLLLSITGTDVTCYGDDNGALDLHVSGGILPYSFIWSNGFHLEDLSGLFAGTYTVTVTDHAGCTDSVLANIEQPDPLFLTQTHTDVSCYNGHDGSINVTVSGGASPYSFTWSDLQSSEDISGLSPGTYSVTVEDNSGCSDSLTVFVSQPDSINIAFTLSPINCYGGNDGAIYLAVTGGVSPYYYSWSNNSSLADQIGLEEGNYTVTVADSNNCLDSITVFLNHPDSLQLFITRMDALCHQGNDGSIDLTVTGGTGPFSYSWSNGSSGQDISGLDSNSYGVTVTNINGCFDSIRTIVSHPTALFLFDSVVPATCGISNGAITVMANGGIPSYEYSINGFGFQSGNQFQNLAAGNYVIEVRDSVNCTNSIPSTVHAISQMNTLIINTDVSCYGYNNGSATVDVLGQNPPYTYSWSNGSTATVADSLFAGVYYLTVTDAAQCIVMDTTLIESPPPIVVSVYKLGDISCTNGNDGLIHLAVTGGTPGYSYNWSSGQSDSILNNLSAGIYELTITDNMGCSTDTLFRVNEPSPLALATDSVDVLCNGENNGIASVYVMGGAGNYSYQWDANTGNQITASATQLPTGNYQVIVMDGNGCKDSAIVTVNEPPPLQILIDEVVNPYCHGEPTGSAVVRAISEAGNISYTWNTHPPQTENAANDLAAGTYEVTAMDHNGCTISTQVILTDPPLLTVNIIPADTTITVGDSLLLQTIISSNFSELHFQWSPDGHFFCLHPCESIIVNPKIATTYFVTVSDENGCMDSASVFIDVVYNNRLDAPNIFTPNGDGINDEFTPYYGESISNIYLNIFDRWGTKVFQTTDLNQKWDGTFNGQPLNPGVYVYWVQAIYQNQERKVFHGSVTLVR